METWYLTEWPQPIVKGQTGYSINYARTTGYLNKRTAIDSLSHMINKTQFQIYYESVMKSKACKCLIHNDEECILHFKDSETKHTKICGVCVCICIYT